MNVSPFRHCPGCGRPGGDWLADHEFRCPVCGFRFFQNVATACGALVVDQGEVLFLVRGREPSRGLWGLPGGFVDPGESAEVALARELTEEIGAEVAEATYLGSFANSYPFAGITYRTCDLYYRVELATPRAALRPEAGEVDALVWVRPEAVAVEQLAFPSLRALWASLRGRGLL